MDFRAERILTCVLRQTDLISVITSFQPNNKEYRDLQYSYLYYLACIPGTITRSAAGIKGVTMSMERFRRASVTDGPFTQVNIAAYTYPCANLIQHTLKVMLEIRSTGRPAFRPS